jgi:hypothetical protein
VLKRPTVSEQLYPTITTAYIVAVWNDELINQLLECVWAAYDLLRLEVLTLVDFSQPSDDLERELTEKLFLRIQRLLDASLPVQPMHAFAERESRPAPPGQPPLYDIAFVLNANDRMCWPLEAKVLQCDRDTSTNLRDYVATFNDRFMTCRYAPFSPSGAMMIYLKSGDSNTTLNHVATRLGCTMTPFGRFPTRAHRTSDHIRVVPSGKACPINFQCHHIAMDLS